MSGGVRAGESVLNAACGVFGVRSRFIECSVYRCVVYYNEIGWRRDGVCAGRSM